MICGFALEPEMVAAWGSRSDYRYFYDKFGIGQPRMMVEFPKLKNWRRQVLQAAIGLDDQELQKVTAMIGILTERMISRIPAAEYDGSRPWLENAELEQAANPFPVILSSKNPRANAAVMVCSSLGEDVDPRWDVVRHCVVNRKASEMAAAIKGLLCNSRQIIFVDPHFGPENARHRRPLEAFIKELVGKHEVEITVLASSKTSQAFFQGECASRLSRIIPEGISVQFAQLAEKPGGEKLHNRYILTDIGGVKFNVGLDDGDDGHTDDVDLMDRSQYTLRWSQYSDESPAFDVISTVLVCGTKR